MYTGLCVGGIYDGQWLTHKAPYWSWHVFPETPFPLTIKQSAKAILEVIPRKTYVYRELFHGKGVWVVDDEEDATFVRLAKNVEEDKCVSMVPSGEILMK